MEICLCVGISYYYINIYLDSIFILSAPSLLWNSINGQWDINEKHPSLSFCHHSEILWPQIGNRGMKNLRIYYF